MNRDHVPEWQPPTGAQYVYAAIADHIAKRIELGDLPPGARLPGERDLASEYGVSVPTARRATAELRERGLVVTLPVKGTFVVESGEDSDEGTESP